MFQPTANCFISSVSFTVLILHHFNWLLQSNSKPNNRFFFDHKNIFLRYANFWFVPYRSRDNFRKNDDLFPIGAFPIGAEDCSTFICTMKILLNFYFFNESVKINTRYKTVLLVLLEKIIFSTKPFFNICIPFATAR